MIRRECRLTRASKYFMGGGGSGSTQIAPATWSQAGPFLKEGTKFQQGALTDFIANNPLLNAAQGGALNFWGQLPSMLSKFGGYEKELGGYQNQLGGFQNQLGTFSNRLGKLSLPFSKYLGQGSALNEAYRETIAPMLRSGGAATPDQLNAAIQAGRISGEQAGSSHDPSAVIQDYLSRKSVTDANFNQALAQSQGVLGQQAGATQTLENILGQQAGIVGQRAGLTSLGAGLTGQKAGLLGQQQALQTGGLNQLLGVGNAAVSQLTGLQAPITSMFGAQTAANVSQAQINAQQEAAANAKMGSTAGGAISAIGSIAPLLLMSDKRMKQKIRGTGLKTEEGIPIKTFEYKTRPGHRILGVMAQDVEKKTPDAVVTDFWSGLKLIDTSKVKIPMGRVA